MVENDSYSSDDFGGDGTGNVLTTSSQAPPPDIAGLNPGIAPQMATAPASTPTPVPSPAAAPGSPHAGLVNMLQGLFLGLDSFARAAASGGKEGGVQEVLEARARTQELKMRSEQSQREAAESKVRIQHLQAETNLATAQMELNRQKLPLELQKLNLDYTRMWLDTAKEMGIPALFAVEMIPGQSMDQHVQGINDKAGGDLVNNAVVPVHTGEYGKGGTSYGFSFDKLRSVNLPIEKVTPLLNNLQNQIDYAKGVEGYRDPSAISADIAKAQQSGASPQDIARLQADLGFAQSVQQSQAKLDLLRKGSTVNGADFTIFSQNLQSNLMAKVAQKSELTKFDKEQAEAKTARQNADPLYKLETDPGQMSGEKSSSAVALLQNKLGTEIDPAQKIRITRLLAQAKSAHQGYLNDVTQKANAEQAAKQGDPGAAGKLLASGDLTLADMKTRGLTPKFIMQAVNAAKAIDPKYNPADETIAEQLAKSPQANQFFGSANSLISKGGTLDQLKEQGDRLPNTKLPLFNNWADAISYHSGDPAIAGFMQTAIGVADDYAKVMGGGQGSDTSRIQVLNSLAAAQNSAQRQAAVSAAHNAVVSQVESRIGKNKFLMRQYGYNLPGQRETSGAANEPTRPNNVPANYVYQKNGPKGEGWYRP